MRIEAQSSYHQTYQEHVDGIPMRRMLRLPCHLFPIQKFKFISRFDVFIGVDPAVEQSPFDDSILCGIENDSYIFSWPYSDFVEYIWTFFESKRDLLPFERRFCRFLEIFI